MKYEQVILKDPFPIISKWNTVKSPSNSRPVLRGLWKKFFHASSIFSLLDPRNEDFHPQITFQRGARGGRHPMLTFLAHCQGQIWYTCRKTAITSKPLKLEGWGWSQSTGNWILHKTWSSWKIKKKFLGPQRGSKTELKIFFGHFGLIFQL